MSENVIKITDDELAEIKMIQSKFQEGVFKFGNLQIEKMELDQLVTDFLEKEKKIKEEWSSLKKLEQSLVDKIAQKYGDGNLNISDGTFTKVDSIKKAG